VNPCFDRSYIRFSWFVSRCRQCSQRYKLEIIQRFQPISRAYSKVIILLEVIRRLTYSPRLWSLPARLFSSRCGYSDYPPISFSYAAIRLWYRLLATLFGSTPPRARSCHVCTCTFRLVSFSPPLSCSASSSCIGTSASGGATRELWYRSTVAASGWPSMFQGRWTSELASPWIYRYLLSAFGLSCRVTLSQSLRGKTKKALLVLIFL